MERGSVDDKTRDELAVGWMWRLSDVLVAVCMSMLPQRDRPNYASVCRYWRVVSRFRATLPHLQFDGMRGARFRNGWVRVVKAYRPTHMTLILTSKIPKKWTDCIRNYVAIGHKFTVDYAGYLATFPYDDHLEVILPYLRRVFVYNINRLLSFCLDASSLTHLEVYDIVTGSEMARTFSICPNLGNLHIEIPNMSFFGEIIKYAPRIITMNIHSRC